MIGPRCRRQDAPGVRRDCGASPARRKCSKCLLTDARSPAACSALICSARFYHAGASVKPAGEGSHPVFPEAASHTQTVPSDSVRGGAAVALLIEAVGCARADEKPMQWSIYGNEKYQVAHGAARGRLFTPLSKVRIPYEEPFDRSEPAYTRVDTRS